MSPSATISTLLRFARYALLPLLAGAGASLAQTSSVPAPEGMTPEKIRQQVDDFLRVETKNYPGQVSYSIGTIANTGFLDQCRRLEVRQNSGARTYGRTMLSARCVDGATWLLTVPVKITVIAPVVTSRRPLANGEVITADDLSIQSGDLGELPAGVITDREQAVGRVVRGNIPQGRPLRADMLKIQSVISQGQTVKITSRGNGFEVSNDGTALNAAGVGDLVRARLPSGQVISGRATAEGRVEINF